MNKQELIKEFEEIGIYSLNVFGAEVKGIPTETAIKLIKQLDEPETGHADEAPRYVKNILARLRELPDHDREVWLKAIMGEFEQDFSHAKWREGYEQGKFEGEWVGRQLKDADKIRQELNKPVIPQFVADWIEVAKSVYSLSGAMTYGGPGVNKWLDGDGSQETFALAWIFGYEVEKEKRYYVRFKWIEDSYSYLTLIKHLHAWTLKDITLDKKFRTAHTRKELEEADFGWVFDCPGIEIEEVE
ncbi:hypothetical protein B7693_04400 [Streptococcus mitis]|uniref:DUF1642 domain-containing protein n=1 Tax=Streptococcus mitis TaxID=28037 RepID=A0A1X1KTI7_STRMT|nr:DUF1642 domain-containing protein [Streptococcus mitis]ORP02763.1 hypothetical protein B7693_04400 [Streptococcus mitis]